MKKQVLLFLSLFVSLTFLGQDKINLVIFSEDGDGFYAFVNGVRQNNKPETNVKVTGVSPNVSLRLEFEDKALPQLKQTMPLDPGFEHTVRIKRDMKKQLKLRYFGSVPLAESQAGIPTVAYHSAEEPSATYNTASPVGNVDNQVNGSTTITSSTTTTTKSTGGTKPNTNTENASININMAGVGINMNVNGMGTEMDNNTTVHSTTSTTVTSSHSSSGSIKTENPAPAVNNTQPVTTSKAGCSVAMSPASFSKMKQAVEAKPFSDTKMSTAKIATKNGCVSASQVMEICKLFSMDDDKLAYAKYAYDYCVDKANYYTVSEVFSFSTTTDEFNKFLEQ